MGCGGSHPVRLSGKRMPKDNVDRLIPQTASMHSLSNCSYNAYTNNDDSHELTLGVLRLAFPDHISPIVCLTSPASPIACAKMKEDLPSGAWFPIIASTRIEKSRVLCVGSPGLFDDECDGKLFLDNAIKWCARDKPKANIRVLMEMESFEETSLPQLILNLGYSLECVDVIANEIDADVVICSSSCAEDDEIREWMTRERGLIVIVTCHSVDSVARYNMNSLLLDGGVAVPEAPPCKTKTKEQIRMNQGSGHLFGSTLEGLYFKLRTTLENKPQDGVVVTIVRALRLNVAMMREDDNKIYEELTNLCWEILKQTHFAHKRGIGRNSEHYEITKLLIEMAGRLPATHFVGRHLWSPFPGPTLNCRYATIERNLRWEGSDWVTTGLWIPGGVECHLIISPECEIQTMNSERLITIQIGTHVSCSLGQPFPWKRFPVISHRFAVTPGEVEIASPYGGILYVCSEDMHMRMTVSVSNVTLYPHYNIDHLEEFEESKSSNTPLAEITTKYLIFTLETSKFKLISNLETVVGRIDLIVMHVFKFTSYQTRRRMRVVFDVEQCDETMSEPIVLPSDYCSSIFLDDSPSPAMFHLLVLVASLALRDMLFSEDVTSSLSTVAACWAFSRVWGDIDPLEFIRELLPSIFNSIWDVYINCQPGTIQEALWRTRKEMESAQNPGMACETHDPWDLFVHHLMSISDKDYMYLLLKEIPASRTSNAVVMSLSSNSLQEYAISDDSLTITGPL